MKDYTVGILEGVEKKKAVKLKEVGQIALVVVVKMGQSLVVERMLLKELKEDVGQLVQPVKIIQEEKEKGADENELGRGFEKEETQQR